MTNFFAPLHAKSLEPLALDMQSLFLTGQVFPFGAKLNVAHVFRSNEKSAVEVVYSFALPRDASLVGFRIEGQGFCISSRLEPRTQAERRYEEAMEAGSLAAITQQNTDGIVNLTVGNLRPGETVSVRLDLVAGVSLNDGGFRLRFPFTVAPCYHPQMRASLNGPNIGTIELPDAVGSGLFLPPMHKDAEPLHEVGFDLRIEPAQGIREVASPSHSIRMALGDPSMVGVNLSPDRDVPNRDLVLDVSRDFGGGQAWSDRPSGKRKHFGLIVPSSALGQKTEQARRVVFVLDRSGSMQGAAMKQARTALENCLATLSLDDHFGIVAFDNTSECFAPGMLPASHDNVQEAREFLSRTEARGGTELAHAIEAAAKLLAGRGEIFVITDGQVFGTVEILRRAQEMRGAAVLPGYWQRQSGPFSGIAGPADGRSLPVCDAGGTNGECGQRAVCRARRYSGNRCSSGGSKRRAGRRRTGLSRHAPFLPSATSTRMRIRWRFGGLAA